MDDILKLAQQLGRRVAEHERTVKFLAARDALHGDAQATQLIEDYHKQMEYIRQREHEQQPVEVADKHKLSELEAQISQNPLVQDFARRQADFVELMNKVRDKIDAEIYTETSGPSEESS